MIKFLDLKKQYIELKQEIDKRIFEVIESSAFIGGKYLELFEKNFAKYCNSKYCLGVANGTDALEIALWALDLPKDSEVLVPANTFIATSEAVTRNNLKVKFVDCDEFYQICPISLQQTITKNTSAVIVVHLYGHPSNMDKILSITKEYNLKLIEDCAQAHGADYNGQKVGSFGDISTFSFYPGKNLGAYGDGGAIITNNKELEEKCRIYANHGRSNKFEHCFEGRNSRLDGLQAGILDIKLPYLNQWIKKRQFIAEYYIENIKNPLIILPSINKNVNAVWHLFVIKTGKRNTLIKYLNSKNIQTGIHYPIALPKLKAYSYLNSDYSHYKAVKEDKYLLSIPIGEHLLETEIDYIVNVINDYKE